MLAENRCRTLCAVILAGGKSRRMGCNKAFLLVEGRPLIARVAREAGALTDQVWISANESHIYDFLGLHTIPDLYAGQGPLAGLHAAMAHSPRPLFLLLACDLPAVREPMLSRLVHSAEGYDAVVPRTADGRLHPLCGVYRRTCLEPLEHNLQLGINKVTDLFQAPSLRVKWLDGTEGGFRDEDLDNLNTPEDLQAYLIRSGGDAHYI